jgi:hypothetical protein
MIKKGITILICDLCGYEKAYDCLNYSQDFLEVVIKDQNKDICKKCANLVMNALVKPKTFASP